MSRLLRMMIGSAVLLAGVFCWVQGMRHSGYLAGATGYLVPLESAAPLTDLQLEVLEEEPYPYLLARESAQSVEGVLFSRRQEATVFAVVGDPGLLFRGGTLKQGAYPIDGSDGCAIDTGSARSLWGDEDAAIGQTVKLDKRELTVTGLLDIPRPVLIVARERRTEWIPTVAAYRPAADIVFPRQALDSFLQQFSLSPVQVSDRVRTADRLRGLALFPAWLLCVMVAARCLRGFLPRLRTLRWTLLAAAAYLCGKLLRFPMLLYPDMLPTQWSDFSFWKTHLRATGETLSDRLLLAGSLPDYLLMRFAYLPTLGWSLAAVVAFVAAARLLLTSPAEN